MIPIRKINKRIEHTLLNPKARRVDIMNLCYTAKQYNFRSVCVNPEWVNECKRQLRGTDVKVVQVFAFPTSRSELLKGDEVDILLRLKGIAKNRKTRAYGRKAIQQTLAYLESKGVDKSRVKAVIETRILTSKEIVLASAMLKAEKVGWVKSSTGIFKRINKRTNLDDLRLIKKGLKSISIVTKSFRPLRKLRPKLSMKNLRLVKFLIALNSFEIVVPYKISTYTPKIKMAGAIRTYEDAIKLIDNGSNLIGCSKSVAVLKPQIVEDKNAKSK